MQASYFNFPIDPLKPVHVVVVCPNCKKTMTELDVAPDSHIAVFERMCCKGGKYRITVRNVKEIIVKQIKGEFL